MTKEFRYFSYLKLDTSVVIFVIFDDQMLMV